jgi:ribosome-associated protein
MLRVIPKLLIPRSELKIIYIRASGPGGQNVNKVSSAVQLRFNIRASRSLADDVKSRLGKLAGNKMNQSGDLIIEAKRYRTREMNRADAEKRLVSLIRKALVQPKKRRASHPTLASTKRRIESKVHKGMVKKIRNSIDE